MNRRCFIIVALGAGGYLGLTRIPLKRLTRVERRARALGADASLIVYHESHAAAERAVSAAFNALNDLEGVLSLYRPQSQICRLNRAGVLEQPHADLVQILRRAINWSRLTDGAFDPTVQPLWNLHAQGGVPDAGRLQAARRLVDWRKVEINDHRVRLGPGQEITLNGIAQGFAADRVRDVLKAHGVRYALANTGEFGAISHKPEEETWRIGIQHPRTPEAYVALAGLDDRFLATSGDYETRFSEDFSSHHIFDPATGRSPAALSSVTVIAPTGLDADALSTALFVLGPDKGLALTSSHAGVEALMVLKNGDLVSTPNFPRCA